MTLEPRAMESVPRNFVNPHRREPRTGPIGTVGMVVRDLDRVTAYYRDMSVAATLDDDCERGDRATSARSRRIAKPRSGKPTADSRPVC
jgi:hypothetical protein